MGKTTIDSSLRNVPQFCCEFDGCRKFFSKLSRLKYHQNTHLKDKPYKCDHEGCTSSYYRPNHLKRHIDIAHLTPSKSPRTFTCSEDGCNAAFETESSLYYHTKRKHSPLPLECSFCDKRFSKKWMLKEHEASHTGENPFRCDWESCEETFKDFSGFKRHKREHEQTKKKFDGYPCLVDDCKLIFPKWSELVAHKKSCHISEGQQNRCTLCNKTFTHRNLKIHMKIHEEDRITLPCPIEGCPRFYFHQKNLTHHIRIKHEGEGYQCKQCSRKLSTKQKLNQHIEIMHKKPRPDLYRKRTTAIEKLEPMTELKWEIKKTGPARYIRQKYNFIKFPAGATENADTNKV